MNTPVPNSPTPGVDTKSDARSPGQKKKGLPIVALLIAAAVLVFIVWGFWRSAQPAAPYFQGQMEAKESDIAPKVTARISRVHVTEGQTIKPGDLLVEMDSLRLLLKLGEERWELLLLQRDELEEIKAYRLEGLLNPQDQPQLEASRSVRDAVE